MPDALQQLTSHAWAAERSKCIGRLEKRLILDDMALRQHGVYERGCTFHLAESARDADVLPAAAEIGAVASLRDRTTVVAAHGGRVVEWLVEDGDLVSPGQPLLRLHPEATS